MLYHLFFFSIFVERNVFRPLFPPVNMSSRMTAVPCAAENSPSCSPKNTWSKCDRKCLSKQTEQVICTICARVRHRQPELSTNVTYQTVAELRVSRHETGTEIGCKLPISVRTPRPYTFRSTAKINCCLVQCRNDTALFIPSFSTTL